MELECYAQRLLNPFRGVMNIIAYQGAEAVTTDGVHWDIYVRDTELVQDLANSNRVQTSDIRYGSWSAEQGLKRGALYPSDDFKVLEHRGAIVYEHLLNQHRQVPFPLTDAFELWLLDSNDRPLALLHSAVREEDLELDCHIDWRAGQECRRQFHSEAMQSLERDAGTQASAGEYLTRHINARAGGMPRAQWFRRTPDNRGEGLQGINLAPQLCGRSLAAESRDLAVEGVEERLGFFLVAAPTLAHHGHAEVGPVYATGRVGGVAVLAGGQSPIGLAVAWPVDALLELLLDAAVTGAARVRDVVVVDRRDRIVGPERIEKLAIGFQAVWRRPPTDDELDVLVQQYQLQHELYTGDVEAAKQLLSVGDSPVVPTGTMPSTPASACRSTRAFSVP